MNNLLLIDWISFGLFIVVIIVTLGIALFLLQKYMKLEDKNNNQLAFCLVFLFLGLGRIFLVYFDYFLTALNPKDYATHTNMWKLATILLLIGVGFLILTSEHALWKGKDYYVFFIGFIIVVSIAMAVPDFEMAQSLSTGAVAFGAFIVLSYMYLAIKLPHARKNILLIFTGFIIYGAALIFLSVFVVDPTIIHLSYLISAIIKIPGLLIIGLGVKKMYFG